ncbi:MAG: T9SS type A sorting domain-containing protein [Ignavibacteriaceae bacterium]|nr:T9SS type A sorting domain-containing protein [Ignavibacteriaceae bacterium]
MKKFSFLFFFLSVFTVLAIPISTSTYPGELIPQQSDSYSFSGETDTLYYLPDSAKFIDKYAIAGEIYFKHTRFSPPESWEYYKVKEIQFLFSSMVLGDTLKQINFYKDTLTNLVYRQNINVVLDSSMVYPHWYSVPLSNEFPVVSGVIEVPLPMNNLFSLCAPTNATASGNTIGIEEASQRWVKTGDIPIKLVIEKITDTIPTVEFNCNMSVQMKHGTFAATDSVWVRGNFNDWAGKAFLLTDPDGDSVYSGLYNNFTVGQSLVFKYVHSPDIWETTGNRTLTVGVGPNFTSACWEDVCVYIPSKIIKVAFSVNMELERLSGLFNPAINKVSVRGSFNGWGETLMTPSIANADLYEVTTDVIAAVDEKINFKFFYSPGTWEVNNLTDMTQNDRYFIVTHAVYDSGSMVYDSVSFNNASIPPPHNQEVSITFVCNTIGTSIISAPAETEFTTVHIAGGNSPLQWPNSGWPDQDITKVIQLYDDGTHNDAVAGDKIFTREITFPMYTSSIIVYKYSANWGLQTNGGKNDNEAPLAGDKTLKLHRLINKATVIDTFGIVHTTVLPDPTKIENVDETPEAFGLAQNYPNPFNPETVINYQLPAGAWTTLKVFDVLGNEVAVLVNEEQSAGTYQVSFNPQLTTNHQQLTSGVYFYQLRAGNFVQTKKMILLR